MAALGSGIYSGSDGDGDLESESLVLVRMYKGHVGASPVEGQGLGWFQDAEVTCRGRGVGMGSLPGRIIGSAATA